MRRFCFPSNAPAGATVSLLVAAVFLLSPAAFSRGAAEKLERASQYCNEADNALLVLQELLAEQRS